MPVFLLNKLCDWKVYLGIFLSLAFLLNMAGGDIQEHSTATMKARDDLRKSLNLLPTVFYEKAFSTGDLAAGENSVFCPLGFSTVLMMLLYGSDGDTKTEIIKALGLPEDLEKLGFQLQELAASMETIDHANEELLIASGMYFKEDFSVSKDFNDALSMYFKTHAVPLNFSDASNAANRMNNWVAESTKHKINNIISPESLDELTRMVLLNAVYLKGKWSDPFDPDDTVPMPFYISEEKTQLTPMMRISGHRFLTGHVPEMDARILSLPFKGRLSVMFLLPNRFTPMENFAQEMRDSGKSLADMCRNLRLSRIDISLPRFKIDYEWKTLKNIAKSLGIESVFQARSANFGRMLGSSTGPSDLFVDEFVQKVVFEVNEEGAEAAGVTSARLSARSLPDTFEAYHPFVFGVIHSENDESLTNGEGTILFQGILNAPTESITESDSQSFRDEL